jgi:hypothetical protein
MALFPDRYVAAETNGGWGFAGAVILLAVVCIVGVTIIHKNTYKHPTDVSWHSKGAGETPRPHAAESTH